MTEHIFATAEEIKMGTKRGLLYVTTLKNRDCSFTRVEGLEDNLCLDLVKVGLSHPYENTKKNTGWPVETKLFFL
jgi:hypothetical protein